MTEGFSLRFDARLPRVDCGEEPMSHTDNDARTRILELNDAFRKNFDPELGQIVPTAGVNSLPSDVKASAVRDSLHRHRLPFRAIARAALARTSERQSVQCSTGE